MNFTNYLKKIACLLLAVLMLFGAIGCAEDEEPTTAAKKKKKVIKKVIIEEIVEEDDKDDNEDEGDDSYEDDWDEEDWDEEWEEEEWEEEWEEEEWEEEEEEDIPVIVRPERELPTVAETLEILDDPLVDEIDFEYKDFSINDSTVIIYAPTKWEGRYEGYSNYEELGTKSPMNEIKYTSENLLAANDLRVWFKDNYNVNLTVYTEEDYKAKVAAGALTGNEKKIIVGDTEDYKSTLKEYEFAVKLVNGNLIFEGGHYAMVESAVDWFRSIEVKEGKVATLTSVARPDEEHLFNSQIEVDGVTYDYIWGDEFDGYEFNDDEKWSQSTFGLERQDDMANIFGDPKFQYVENGKIRLTGDRYYDEGNAKVGYATSGQIDTNGSAIFRNGYFEFYARLPYRRGGFPAIWTMTADASNEKVPNLKKNDGFGVYNQRVWDLEFDLFESFADSDHMTTTIHKWYTPKYFNENNYTSFTSFGSNGNSKDWVDLTLAEEKMVEADLANKKGPAAERYNWTVENPDGTTLDSAVTKGWVKSEPDAKDSSKNVAIYYYVEKDQKVYVSTNEIVAQNDQINAGELLVQRKDTYDDDGDGDVDEYLEVENPDNLPVIKEDETWQWKLDNKEIKPAHMRVPIIFNFEDGPVDTFKYRLSPYTNLSTSMATYAYSFSYTGTPSDRRKDEDGTYGDWRWYFNSETINNEYHLYAFKYTSDHCTVYMDGEKFLDFDWDPAYDYKDLDGDGKGDDISRNNNGVGFNFWQYFLIDMMIYTPGNFNIDYARKIQVGDCPFHLYIDYVRFYQDLDDPSQAVHYINGVGEY